MFVFGHPKSFLHFSNNPSFFFLFYCTPAFIPSSHSLVGKVPLLGIIRFYFIVWKDYSFSPNLTRSLAFFFPTPSLLSFEGLLARIPSPFSGSLSFFGFVLPHFIVSRDYLIFANPNSVPYFFSFPHPHFFVFFHLLLLDFIFPVSHG